MNYLAAFFAGAFLCNGIPHLASGLQGAPFPTPFSKPRGVGDSSPLVNFLWGFFNFLVGVSLLSRHPVAVGFNPGFIAGIVGALVIGTHLSLHFGKVRQDKSTRSAAIAMFSKGPPFFCMLFAACLLTGCAAAKVTGQRQIEATTPKPSIIYVADFGLDAQHIQSEGGLLSRMPGPIGRIGDHLDGKPRDPEAWGGKLVELMSNSLVKDLNKAGLTSVRLAPGAALPTQGWLVRGRFTEVQEGNRFRRSMIGLGVGKTDLEVTTSIDKLSRGSAQLFYELDTDANSGKLPGAAPSLVLGPFGAIIRFVLSDRDMNKSVKQTASKISAQIAEHVKGDKPGHQH